LKAKISRERREKLRKGLLVIDNLIFFSKKRRKVETFVDFFARDLKKVLQKW
jgi:hypothetical protein